MVQFETKRKYSIAHLNKSKAMDSSPPPERQRLPLHLHLHHEQQQEEAPPHTLSFAQSTNFSFNQLECRSGSKARVHDSLGLSLSSDRSCRQDSSVVGDELAWRSSVPLGPFTGYASILNRSRFLKPAQDLLDELCGLDPRRAYSVHGFCDDGMDLIRSDDVATSRNKCKDQSSLILVLDEVFKRYKQHYQHLQSVVASFEAVRGLENAAPYISFAFGTMAQQFSCLKKTIFERAQIAGGTIGYTSISNVALGCKDSHTRCENLKPNQTSPAIQHPVWRSQRGLPAYAVAVFKNWLFEHFLHPYPSDTDKNLLAQRTGLSRNQVSNWFINARVRLWKPLVEEIHTLGEQRGQPALKNDQKTSKATVLHQPPGTHLVDHQARTVALQMSVGTHWHGRFNPSCSELSTDYHSTSATNHGKPDEKLEISLGSPTEGCVSGATPTTRNDLNP